MQVSVITTVYNEEKTIGAFLDALLAQSQLPNEIVVADACSADRTAEIVRGFGGRAVPVRLLVQPGNRSVGRNAAIRAARFPVIACSDAGCMADRDWLKNIVRPFEEKPGTTVVSGFCEAQCKTLFEECTKALMLSTRKEIDPATWLPSSRSVAFTREAWETAGGYPEWLTMAEDTVFDKQLLAAGHRFVFVPDAVVYWEPRPDLRGFFDQYNGYSRSDGEGWIDAVAHIRRTLRVAVGAGALVVGLVWLPLLMPVLALAAVYLTRRCLKVYRRLRSVRAFLLAWVLAVTYDLASVFGFWRGVLDRRLVPRRPGAAWNKGE
ncbi:MAG: glycosyltransferase [Chloroflexi bacterium]|nr:glycosyltransferase [Chloroflexota bacterium]